MPIFETSYVLDESYLSFCLARGNLWATNAEIDELLLTANFGAIAMCNRKIRGL